MNRVIVAGGGVAGLAAALAAKGEGAEVLLVHDRPGASVLGSGALDHPASDERPGEKEALSQGERAVLTELGFADVRSERVLVLTLAGVLRHASGRDRAVLDLSRIPSGDVAVASVDHYQWDSELLARSWSSSRLARERGLKFLPIAVALLRFRDESSMSPGEIARRHDDSARAEWLAERVSEAWAKAKTKAVALVLPPWLGVRAAVAPAIEARIGVPCGEPLSAPGGAAGLRFEQARDDALTRAGVDVRRAELSLLAETNRSVRVETASGERWEADGLVVAMGGLLGGGITYAPSESSFGHETPTRSERALRFACEAPLVVGASGRAIERPGSLFGVPPEQLARSSAERPLLERAGVLADESGRAEGCSRIFVAGDIVADRPRVWLEALRSGVVAGTHAARLSQPATERTAPTPH